MIDRGKEWFSLALRPFHCGEERKGVVDNFCPSMGFMESNLVHFIFGPSMWSLLQILSFLYSSL